tara:strand:+ start:5164 stop:5796 length:633 start_codon:yes stop_codon:yes gene_type:complete
MPASIMHVRDSVNHKNKVLEVDGLNQLSVKDAIAQSSLSNIESSVANLTSDPATAGNQSLGNMSLTNIESSVANLTSDPSTATLQTAANLSLNNIDTALAGTITVSSAAPARASGSLASAVSKTAGDLSASVDGNIHRKCAIFGSCSSDSGSVKVHISHDNVNFFEDNQAQYYANFSNGHIAGHFDLNARYFKVEFLDTATYTIEYAMCD